MRTDSVRFFISRFLRKNASAGELVWISRIFVALITVVACIMALAPSKTIFDIVKFAWGGFGAAFGPVVIMSLYSRRMTWVSALAGMVTGTVVMMVWYMMGWNSFMKYPPLLMGIFVQKSPAAFIIS